MDTKDLGVLMFCLLTGLPFIAGFYLGRKSAKFSWPEIRWPWREW